MSRNLSPLRRLSARQELEYLFEIHGPDNYSKLFGNLNRQFDVLQRRAQLLLSLVTICLTITGFSGPKIAASGPFARVSLIVGLAFVLVSAILILLGPLQLRWGTQRRAGSMEDSLIHLLDRRNARTRKYHVASVLLVLGLAGYVGSVLGYLFAL